MKQTFLTFLLLLASADAVAATRGPSMLQNLLRVARFVGWPEGAVGAGAFVICAQGDSASLIAAAGTEPAQRWHGLPVKYRKVATPGEALSCQMLFLSANGVAVKPFLKALGTRPVLTVGTDREFVRGGGQIAVLDIDGKPFVQLNVATLRRSGLRVNPQLLQVASIYSPDGAQP